MIGEYAREELRELLARLEDAVEVLQRIATAVETLSFAVSDGVICVREVEPR